MHADATLAAEEPFVLATVKNGVTTLTLNRPQRFNPLSSQMIAAIQAELVAIANDPSVRVVVLAVGEGPSLYLTLQSAYRPRLVRGVWDGNSWRWVELGLPVVPAG